MGQRLGIAAALLGDPEILLLDEPVNGLDPEGILWIRNLLKQLASEGRTILVSSHLMNEMAVTADHLVVIGQGKLIAECPVDEFISRFSHGGAGGSGSVLVRSPQWEPLAAALAAAGAAADPNGERTLIVTGLDAPAIGEVAAANGIVLHELTPQRASLEDAFMEMTKGTGDFAGHLTGPFAPAPTAPTAEGV
jgi:ABC-2 type transport system ATP-binding protein